MQAKLVKFEPRLIQGTNNQETFNGRNGMLYKFNITFNINGTDEVGEYSSSKETPSWKTGEDYTFERTVRGQQGQFIVYKDIKSVNQQFNAPRTGGGKSGGIDFARQKALECASAATPSFWCSENNKDNLKPDIYTSPAKAFFKAITETGQEADIWLNIAALNAVVARVDRVEDMQTPEGVKVIDHWISEMKKMRIELFDAILAHNTTTTPQ